MTITHLHADAEGIPAISRWLRSVATTPPDHRVETKRIPEGCQPDRSSVQIPILVFHTRLLQTLDQLFAKRLRAMMLGLVRDVFLHLRPRCRAHRERPIAFLPGELLQPDFLMHPDRRCLLQLPHEIGQTMRGLQSHQQMHMVGHASDSLRKSAKPSHGAAEVFVQSVSPRGVDERHSIFGGENDVAVQDKKGRGHNDAVLLASLRDAGRLRIVSGGIATLNHRLMALMPSASHRRFPTAWHPKWISL